MADHKQLIERYHKSAYEFISEALKIDEEYDSVGKKMHALRLYRNGADELRKGLAFKTDSVTDKARERTSRLCEKMSTNLKMATERINDIGRAPSIHGQRTLVPLAPGWSPSDVEKQLKNEPTTSRHRPDSCSTKGRTVPKTIKHRSKSPPNRKMKSDTTNIDFIAKSVQAVKKLKGLDSKLGNFILDQVLETRSLINFNDVAGLEHAKQALNEAVVLPMLKPESTLYIRHCLGPEKIVRYTERPLYGALISTKTCEMGQKLLYRDFPYMGIPYMESQLFLPVYDLQFKAFCSSVLQETEKTMLAKAISGESKCVFFNISASALTSKWVGEAEKLVKILFVLARELQPVIIFIDEVDSILCERSDKENEVSRRLKTEFLLQFDGVSSSADDKVLIIGATNRPRDLDDAILRRFPKRIYVGLPDVHARRSLLETLLIKHNNPLNTRDMDYIARRTENYSNFDLTQLAKEAAMGPIREMSPEQLIKVNVKELRAISLSDFEAALNVVKPTCKREHIKDLLQFNDKFGSSSS